MTLTQLFLTCLALLGVMFLVFIFAMLVVVWRGDNYDREK